MNLKSHVKKSHLIKVLGRPLYNRSVKYLENAHIAKKRNTEDCVYRFIVSGGGGRYKVRIEFHRDNSTFTHSCSCYADGYCEHVGAILIKHFELPDNPLVLGNFCNEEPDTIIPINTGGTADGTGECLPACQ